MAEELRLALILLGALAIGSVILHGIWTVRKNSEQQSFKKKVEPQKQAEKEPEVDLEEQKLKLKQMEINFADLKSESGETGLPVVDMDVDAIYQKEPAAEEPSQQESEDNNQITAPEVNRDMDDDLEPSMDISSVELDDEHYHEMDISSVDDDDEPRLSENSVAQKEPEPEKQEVFILFVSKEEGEPIDGARLLPTLLTLGFKFGEMDFFHRHQDNAGNGDILFSIANMYNPGTFDVDNMEQMSTRGLSIFMTLPNSGEPLQTFNMMHNAAKKIAEEFNAKVLDEHRRPLDVAIVRQYVKRIRNF